jgi:preprotein translocase subunit SecA
MRRLNGAGHCHLGAVVQAFRVDDLPIESGMLTDALDNAQRKVEAYFFDIRKQLWEYDQVLNSQRDRIYSERRKALLSSSLESVILEYSEETMNDILEVRPSGARTLGRPNPRAAVLHTGLLRRGQGTVACVAAARRRGLNRGCCAGKYPC